MTLVKYNNRILSPGIFNLLTDIFSEDFETPGMSYRRESIPAVNIRQDEKTFIVEMAVPGLDKKDIHVEIEEDVLTISSEKKEESHEEKENFTRREFHFSSFKRSFNIPESADGSKIEAKQENGVLYIRIPKKEAKAISKKTIAVG
jgi:HSP20 family protein